MPLRRGALFSVAVGFVSSFHGIGGGVIHVPLLVGALGFPTHLATATSRFVLTFMAAAGSITNVLAGSFHHGVGLRRAAALSVGVVGGSTDRGAPVAADERLADRAASGEHRSGRSCRGG